MTAFVAFDDVWLAYTEELLAAGHYAVEGITLRAEPGEFIAIVGPSGCGKSTFMKLTTGLKMPSRGRIVVDGRQVTGPLKISGMAFQSSSLLPWRAVSFCISARNCSKPAGWWSTRSVAPFSLAL